MSLLHGFTFKKGLNEMKCFVFRIRRSAGRVPRVKKKKLGLGPFRLHKKKKKKEKEREKEKEKETRGVWPLVESWKGWGAGIRGENMT